MGKKHPRKELGPQAADLASVSHLLLFSPQACCGSPPSKSTTPWSGKKETGWLITCVTNETDISIKWILNKQQLKAAKNIFLSKDSKNLTIDPIKKEMPGNISVRSSLT